MTLHQPYNKVGSHTHQLLGVIPGIEHRCFCPGIAANEQDGVSLLNSQKCSVHDVIASHVCIQIREAAVHIQIAAAQSVEEILQRVSTSEMKQKITVSITVPTRACCRTSMQPTS